MSVEDVRLGLLETDETMKSGYRLIEEIYINVNPKVDITFNAAGSKIIRFSPFKDKNGRLLKEGDRVTWVARSSTSKPLYGTVSIFTSGAWIIEWDDKIHDMLFSLHSITFEYTGNIYLKEN